MSEASKSQIAFARTIVRYALYQSILNIVPIAWAIGAFGFGIPNEWYWPSFWLALTLYGGGALYLLITMLLPAIRMRIKEREMEGR
jgi:hypothetical protein